MEGVWEAVLVEVRVARGVRVALAENMGEGEGGAVPVPAGAGGAWGAPPSSPPEGA